MCSLRRLSDLRFIFQVIFSAILWNYDYYFSAALTADYSILRWTLLGVDRKIDSCLQDLLLQCKLCKTYNYETWLCLFQFLSLVPPSVSVSPLPYLCVSVFMSHSLCFSLCSLSLIYDYQFSLDVWLAQPALKTRSDLAELQ